MDDYKHREIKYRGEERAGGGRGGRRGLGEGEEGEERAGGSN